MPKKSALPKAINLVIMNTPNYIKSLVTPTTKQPQGRKVWSIDLEMVWLKFFTATNAMGDTAIPSDAIGCPLRLGYDKAGAVRFSPSGRPVIRVAKEIADSVKLVRDNFTAGLLNYAGEVMRERGEEYKAQVVLAQKAGEPIYQHDKLELSNALKARAEAEAKQGKRNQLILLKHLLPWYIILSGVLASFFYLCRWCLGLWA